MRENHETNKTDRVHKYRIEEINQSYSCACLFISVHQCTKCYIIFSEPLLNDAHYVMGTHENMLNCLTSAATDPTGTYY